MDLNSRQISTIPDSEGFYSPRWSPDGRYIAALQWVRRPCRSSMSAQEMAKLAGLSLVPNMVEGLEVYLLRLA